MTKRTTIAVEQKTKEDLRLLGQKDEDYDSIIKQTINFTKKFNNENQFKEWFKENFMLFGFDSIVKENINGTPDFIMIRKGKQIKVELETLASHYINHGHTADDVDLVICLVKNRNLPVKTLEISLFEYENNYLNSRKGLTTIQVTPESLEMLKSVGRKGESYSNIIKRLAKNYIDIDEGLKKQLKKTSESIGIEENTLFSFGISIIIFLANSGLWEQLQDMAKSKRKPIFIIALEFLKKLKI